MLNAFAEGHEGEINPLLPTLPDLVWGTLAFVIILALFIWKVLPRLNKMLDARSRGDRGQHQVRRGRAGRGAGRSREVHRSARRRARRGRDASASRLARTARRSSPSCASRPPPRPRASPRTRRRRSRWSASRALVVAAQSDVGNLALDLAGGVIGETLSEDAKAQAVVDRFLAELEASEKATQLDGQRNHSGTRGDDGGARRRVGGRPRHRPRALRRGADRGRLAAAERRARRPRRVAGRPRARRDRRLRRGFRPDHALAADDRRSGSAGPARPTWSTASRSSPCARPRSPHPASTSRASCSASRGLVAENPELELALGSRLGDDPRQGRARRDAARRPRERRRRSLIVSSLVQQPRERRVRQLLSQRDGPRRRPARHASSRRSSRPRRSAPRSPSA